MSEKTVEKVLKDFGLTKNELEIYVFLAKHGVLKSKEVAKQIRKDNAQVLRILKSIQKKGLVESTLESPKRFLAVPFEKVLDAFVKAKRDEATLIESTKRDLLLYWRSIGKTKLEAPLEKFVVIEGDNKIYSKISQMITETKNQLSINHTVRFLLRADQRGLFDLPSSNPIQGKIQLRFLTELSDQNSEAVNLLLEKISKVAIRFTGKNSDLGVTPSPRMVIRDEEEVLLFIQPRAEASNEKQATSGLWTNCKTLVQTFASVFEDLWRNATEIEKALLTADTSCMPPKAFSLSNTKTFCKKFDEILNSAKNEITFMTSSQGLIELWKNTTLLKDWIKKGVSIKIMAPTTIENLRAVEELSEFCDVKHISESRVKTTIVDGKHVFQSKNPISNQEIPKGKTEIEYTFYTTDYEYVNKTKAVLNDVWNSSQRPTAVTLESIINPATPTIDPFREAKVDNPYTKGIIYLEEHKRGTLTEKDIVNKILNAKKIAAKDPMKDITLLCGSSASAIIHPPNHFSLPDMMINVWHCDKQSSWGAEDWVTVCLWLNTPKGYRYVPVAHVTDNVEALEFRKGVYAGTPAGKNCQLVNTEQFHVQVHGTALFAGWTSPIPLFPPPYVLPPSCLLFEGYGELKTTATKTWIPSGRTQVIEANRYDAFVTFFHPASKYSGPGTEGMFSRDVFCMAYPPP